MGVTSRFIWRRSPSFVTVTPVSRTDVFRSAAAARVLRNGTVRPSRAIRSKLNVASP